MVHKIIPMFRPFDPFSHAYFRNYTGRHGFDSVDLPFLLSGRPMTPYHWLISPIVERLKEEVYEDANG